MKKICLPARSGRHPADHLPVHVFDSHRVVVALPVAGELVVAPQDLAFQVDGGQAGH